MGNSASSTHGTTARPLAGYWHDGHAYCTQCAQGNADSDSTWEPINTQSEPMHDLVCWQCGGTVVVAPADG